MSDEYKKLIMDRINDEINRWIGELKEQHQDLLLTRQWQVLFPKGFQPGHIVIPVVTGGKQGKHLIGEIEFVLPDDLNLDINEVKLALKDEAYQEQKPVKPVSIDEPLDLLNRVVVGMNDFLKSLSIAMPAGEQLSLFQTFSTGKDNEKKVMNGASILQPFGSDLERIKREMLSSTYLPEWIKTIEDKQVYGEFIDKLVPAYVQYQRSSSGSSSLKDFFEKYTSHLLSHGHLHYYCKYKGKPIELDDWEHCTEAYCSKKPYNSKCPMAVLKFGKE